MEAIKSYKWNDFNKLYDLCIKKVIKIDFRMRWIESKYTFEALIKIIYKIIWVNIIIRIDNKDVRIIKKSIWSMLLWWKYWLANN
jgi:hypothetical protein